jgi:hypothetical protein
MAKKDVVEVLFKFSDGKTLKVLGDKAKQAGASMKSMARSVSDSDRRLKGLSRQSSNASKNFSKQAQTISGGIVPIYATLAAQLFAVSAAFRFLQDSFEVRNMIEGQKQFGAVTGIAYQTLTVQLQDATAGMLGFKEAASSLAIGIASGLSGDQVTQLGTAAKNASLALGRDLTDSFNRLIRGVTKAEPELLDELGIILRLENATREYAQTIGKTKDQLNAYERTQAVMNNVMTQATEKYGRIAEVMDPDSFALGQLTKEFDDLVRGFQVGLSETLLPLIGFLKDNVMALTAALVLFARPIVGSMLPDLNAMGAAAKKNFGEAQIAAATANEEMNIAATSAAMVKADPVGTQKSAGKGLQALGVELKGTDASGKKKSMLSKQQIAAYKVSMRKKQGIYMKFNIEEKAAFRKHVLEMEQIHAAGENRQVDITSEAEYRKAAERAKHEEKVAKREMRKSQAKGGIAAGVQGLMKWVGYLGIALMAAQMLWSGISFLRDLDEDAKKAREATKKLQESLGTLNEELDRMATIRGESILGGAESLEQVGNAFQSVDIGKKMREYNEEVKKGISKKTQKEFDKLGKSLQFMSPQMAGLTKEFAAGNEITDDTMKKYQQMSNAMIDASQASKMLEENTKSLNSQLTKAVGKYGKLPYQDLQKSIISQIDLYNRMIGGMAGETNAITKEKRQFNTGLVGNTEDRKEQLKQIPTSRELEELYVESRRTMGSDYLENFSDLTLFEKMFTGPTGPGDALAQDSSSIAAGEKLKEYAQILGITAEEISDGGGGLAKALIKVTKQQREWTMELDSHRRKQEHLGFLQIAINNYVKEGMKNQQEVLDISQETVVSKLKGVGIQQRMDQNDLKTRTAQLKAGQAFEKHLAAKANLLNVNAGIEDNITQAMQGMQEQNVQDGKAKELTTEQLEEISRLSEKLRDDTNLDLVAARKSIDLTRQEFEIANLNSELSIIMVASANRLLQIKESTLNVEREITRQKQIQAENTAQRSADGFNTVLGEWQAANAALTDLRNMQTQQKTKKTDMLTELKTQFGSDTAAQTKTWTTGTSKADGGTGLVDHSAEIPGFDKVDFTKDLQYFKDESETGIALTQKQKDFNTNLAVYEALLSKIAVDGSKISEETNVLSGEAAMKALELETDKMKMWEKRVYTMNPIENAYQLIRLENLRNNIDLEKEGNEKLKERAILVATATTNLKVEQELMDGIQSTIENGFVSMFQAMVDGTKSFKDSMKDLTKSVLSDMAAMYLKAAALKFMMAFMPGGGAVMEFLKGTARYGGELNGPGYATGGIANGPNSGYQATLHGREAVVPLGNDRSIPVDIRGASGNTVNVSISMQGGQSNTSVAGGGDMQALGRSIGGLVQQHLQVEMRPGGLLNRQGAKGRV